MTETKPKRRWFSFSIRDLLLVTVIAALATGWWLGHRESERVPELLDNLRKANQVADDLMRQRDNAYGECSALLRMVNDLAEQQKNQELKQKLNEFFNKPRWD